MKRGLELIRANKLFLRILLYFLSLLIPVIIIGVFTYINFVNQIKNDYNEKIMMNLKASADTVDNYWQTIHESSVVFFSDPTVARLLKPADRYTSGEWADIYQLPLSIGRTWFSVNRFVDELFVYADNHYVYTSSGINDYKAFFGKFYSYKQVDQDYWERKMDSGKFVDILNPMLVGTPFGQKSVISFVTTNRIGRHNAVLVATVPVSQILKTMDVILEPGVTRVIVTDQNGDFILTSDAEFDNHGAVKLLARDAESPRIQESEIDLGKERYTASVIRTGLYNWTFYAITPINEFKGQASGILSMMIGICIALCLIGCLFSFIFSFKIYNPIRKIGEVLSRKESGLEWGEQGRPPANDLERIGDGIHQLISYRHRYQDELQTLTLEYMDHALFQLIKGNERNEEQDEELEKMMQVHLGFESDSYLCCAITFDFIDKFYHDIQDVDRIVIQSKLKNLIFGLLSEHVKLYVLECSKQLFLCVINLDRPQRLEDLKNGLDQFVATFSNDRLYCRIHIGIGEDYKGLDGVTKSYRDALTALQSIGEDQSFMVAHAKNLNVLQSFQYPFADENRLLNLLKVGDTEGLTGMVEQMLANSEERSLSFYVRNALLGEMYGTGMRFALERGLDINEILTVQEQGRLSRQSDLPAQLELRQQLLVRFFHGIVGMIVNYKQPYKSNALAMMIKQYVEEHYTTDLYLETIAAEMNISVKYASRVFKENFDINLTDYISSLRISKAKELLVDSSLTVHQIAEGIGFFNRTTFLRTFKRFEGISPNDYRKLNQKR